MKKGKVSIIAVLSLIVYHLMVYVLYRLESNAEGGNILNIADAYWYSIVTLTTVGYGDFYPITFWGRLLGFLFVMGSLGILGLMVTKLSQLLSEYLRKKREGYYGTTMKEHCVIIGWDDFSRQVADQIVKAQKSLAIITNSKEGIDRIGLLYEDKNCFSLLSDLKNYDNFEKANISQAERIYLNFEDDSETLVHTINLKKKYPNATFVVALNNMELKSTFNFMGVSFVISKSEIASKLIASYIFEPHAAMFAEDLLATSEREDELDIWELKLSNNSVLIQRPYLELFLELKKEHNAVLLGVVRKGELLKNPNDLELAAEDILVFIGGVQTNNSLKQLM